MDYLCKGWMPGHLASLPMEARVEAGGFLLGEGGVTDKRHMPQVLLARIVTLLTIAVFYIPLL